MEVAAAEEVVAAAVNLEEAAAEDLDLGLEAAAGTHPAIHRLDRVMDTVSPRNWLQRG